MTRRVRLSLAPAIPDVTGAVLDRLPAPPPRSRRRWTGAALRLALLAVGAGQLALSLPAFAADGVMAAPAHLAHETGAWNLGLAACFLVVAATPRLAAGALPFLLPFTAVLSWTTLSDLGAGHVHAGRAVAHLLLVGGALLVSVLAVRGRAPRGGPVRALRSGPWTGLRRSTGRAGEAAPHADGPVPWREGARADAGGRRAA